MIKSINRQKLIQLVTGIVGIYFCFFIGSLLHQYILKRKYINRVTGQQIIFKQLSGLVAFERLIIWVYGAIYNRLTLPKQKNITLPLKNNLLCAGMSFIGFLTNAYAIAMVSFPIVMIFKSCNILSVIIIALLCTRVRNKSLQLGGKKLIVALAVSIGIIVFKVFDPEAKQGDQKKTQLWGLIILVISLLADGFVPDFQAQIKAQYNPEPTVMMSQINKWCFIISLLSMILSGQFMPFLYSMWYYPLLDIHLISMTSLAFVGNIFVYNMIRNFKQHIVPFVITTRKIISIGLSVIFYRHQTSPFQIIGLVLVFVTVIFEFITQITKQQPSKKTQKDQKSPEYQKDGHQQNKQINSTQIDELNTSRSLQLVSEQISTNEYINQNENRQLKEQN